MFLAQIEKGTIIWIVACVVVIAILIVIYAITNNARKKRYIKNYTDNEEYRKIYGDQGKLYTECIKAIDECKRYNGTIKSVPSKTKKLIEKYFITWFKDVPEELLLMRHYANKKCLYLVICYSKTLKLDFKPKNYFCFDIDNRPKKNANSLIKVAGKAMCLEGTIKLLQRIYAYEVRNYSAQVKPEDMIPIFEAENGTTIYYEIASKTRPLGISKALINAVNNANVIQETENVTASPAPKKIVQKKSSDDDVEEDENKEEDAADIIEEVAEDLVSMVDGNTNFSINNANVSLENDDESNIIQNNDESENDTQK